MIIHKIAQLLQRQNPCKRWVTLRYTHPTGRVIAVFLLLLTINAHAAFNVYEFNDDAQEARFTHLINELRCPKCQNNTLADSNAPLATDIKTTIYQAMQSGKSDAEIREFLISRYGIFIVYDPKVMWIWLIPLLVVVGGVGWTLREIKHARKRPVPNDLPSMAILIAEHKAQKTNGSANA